METDNGNLPSQPRSPRRASPRSSFPHGRFHRRRARFQPYRRSGQSSQPRSSSQLNLNNRQRNPPTVSHRGRQETSGENMQYMGFRRLPELPPARTNESWRAVGAPIERSLPALTARAVPSSLPGRPASAVVSHPPQQTIQNNNERFRHQLEPTVNPTAAPRRLRSLPEGLASQGSMPKNFATPLTCFFWKNNGRCSKSDEDCWYAHYDTGVVAAAPVTVGGRSVAGRQAEEVLASTSEQEDRMKAREESVTAREQNLITMVSRVAYDLRHFDGFVDDFQEKLNETKAALNICRDDLNRQGRNIDFFANPYHQLNGILDTLATAASGIEQITQGVDRVYQDVQRNMPRYLQRPPYSETLQQPPNNGRSQSMSFPSMQIR